MERVTGIGGVFFRSDDPDALSTWYAEHLGIDPVPTSYDARPWSQEAGYTAFAPMSPDVLAQVAPGDRPWAMNFRVHDLDAMATQLRDAGIDVAVDPETYPNGRFAQLADPEGNPIQLWQPAEPGGA